MTESLNQWRNLAEFEGIAMGCNQPGSKPGCPVGIFWDQSLVWGLLCVETLGRAGVPFRLLGSADIRGGCLENFRVLMVPGGWAAHKIRALGESGKRQLAAFLEEGGSYIGFCGGAGMALSSTPALYFAPIERMPLGERLPSASGRINVRSPEPHPAWEGIPAEIPVSVWWPSQFNRNTTGFGEARPLAVYSTPMPDFQVADLRVCDVSPRLSWSVLEKAYGINLDPAKLEGHPAIVEVRKGKGTMVLSYAHLETPGDEAGNRLLLNLLAYLDSRAARAARAPAGVFTLPAAGELPGVSMKEAVFRAKSAAAELIDFGEANLLWNWRKPWLLNWRRGIRGLECGTLYIVLDFMAGLLENFREDPGGGAWDLRARKLEQDTAEFCSKARQLLLEEKIAAQSGVVRKLGRVNLRVDALRTALFGDRMNHGGLCRSLFDLIDTMLLDLLRQAQANGALLQTTLKNF